jgi:hypothetical protein
VPQSAINPTIQFVLFENSGKRVKLFFLAFITFFLERKGRVFVDFLDEMQKKLYAGGNKNNIASCNQQKKKSI